MVMVKGRYSAVRTMACLLWCLQTREMVMSRVCTLWPKGRHHPASGYIHK